jgi:hypothetical protein
MSRSVYNKRYPLRTLHTNGRVRVDVTAAQRRVDQFVNAGYSYTSGR